MDPRITKLADLLTNYSCGIKPGEKLLVECIGFDAVPLVHEVVHAATLAGGIVFTNIRHDRLTRRFLHDADEEQIKAQAKYDAIRMKEMQCYIGVRGTPNTMEMGDVPGRQAASLEQVLQRPGPHEGPRPEDALGGPALAERLDGPERPDCRSIRSRTSTSTSAPSTTRRCRGRWIR